LAGFRLLAVQYCAAIINSSGDENGRTKQDGTSAKTSQPTQPLQAIHTPIEKLQIAVTRNPIPPEGFMRLPAVLSVIPVCRATWLAGCKSGRFPKPVKLGPKMVAWKVQDIRSLIASFDTAANDQNGGL